jgi:hypothetical protein
MPYGDRYSTSSEPPMTVPPVEPAKIAAPQADADRVAMKGI